MTKLGRRERAVVAVVAGGIVMLLWPLRVLYYVFTDPALEDPIAAVAVSALLIVAIVMGFASWVLDAPDPRLSERWE